MEQRESARESCGVGGLFAGRPLHGLGRGDGDVEDLFPHRREVLDRRRSIGRDAHRGAVELSSGPTRIEPGRHQAQHGAEQNRQDDPSPSQRELAFIQTWRGAGDALFACGLVAWHGRDRDYPSRHAEQAAAPCEVLVLPAGTPSAARA